MITDSTRYYGSVLHYVIDNLDDGISVSKIGENVLPGFFLMGGKIPVQIKYCTFRKGPWSFNYKPLHRRVLAEAFEKFGACIAVMVCAKDGIVAIGYNDLNELFEGEGSVQENVSVRRGHREMYEVKGPNGVLGRKLGRNSLIVLLEEALGSNR